MAILFSIILVILTFLVFKYVRMKRHFSKHGIPHPPEIPFFGFFASSIFTKKHMIDTLNDIYNFDKSAKYFGCHMFMNPMIVLRDLDLIKSVLVKDFDHFADRKTFVDENTDPLFGKNLVSLNGKRWKEVRNILSPCFTSSRMRAMFVLMSRCAENFVESFIGRFGDCDAIDTKDAFTRYANDVIATCAFGLEVDSLKEPENDFYTHGKHALKDNGKFTLPAFLLLLVPTIAKKIGCTLVPKEDTKYFVNIIGNTINARREMGIKRPDMLQLLMDAQGKTIDFDVLDVTAQSFLFFLGGFETSSMQMCWMAHELAMNPEIQLKLQQEIDSVMKDSDNKPSYEAVNNMTYLDAIFSEALRLNGFPLLNRLCSKEFELPPALPGSKPYLVKPGIDIAVPASAIHRDPQYYENPDVFDPDRFLNKKSSSSDVTTLGFGLGPRMCVANRFGILEAKVLIFHLLAKCNVRPCYKTCTPCVYDTKNFFPSPKGGFWLKIERRK